jgi:hypothetical protein
MRAIAVLDAVREAGALLHDGTEVWPCAFPKVAWEQEALRRI